MPYGEHGNRCEVVWYGIGRDRFLGVETCHLMNEKAPGCRFHGELRGCGSEVILTMCVVSGVEREGILACGKDEHRCSLRPLVSFHEAIHHFLMLSWSVFVGDHKAPGLFVEARSGPSSRFQERANRFHGYCPVGKCPGAPTGFQ